MRVIKSAPERLQVALFPPAAIGSALDDPGWRSRRWLLCHGRVQLIVLLQEGRLICCIARSSGIARSSDRCFLARCSSCCTVWNSINAVLRFKAN